MTEVCRIRQQQRVYKRFWFNVRLMPNFFGCNFSPFLYMSFRFCFSVEQQFYFKKREYIRIHIFVLEKSLNIHYDCLVMYCFLRDVFSLGSWMKCSNHYWRNNNEKPFQWSIHFRERVRCSMIWNKRKKNYMGDWQSPVQFSISDFHTHSHRARFCWTGSGFVWNELRSL